jgi:hypothetical protein
MQDPHTRRKSSQSPCKGKKAIAVGTLIVYKIVNKMRDDLLSVGLSRISVKTLQIAKEKYDRGRNEKKVRVPSSEIYRGQSMD